MIKGGENDRGRGGPRAAITCSRAHSVFGGDAALAWISFFYGIAEAWD